MPAAFVVAFSVCAITVPELALAPLTLVCVTVHAKVVPPVLLDRVILEAFPEQILCEVAEAVTLGAGFTVTVAVIAEPGQLLAVGVIVYTAVPGLEVVAVKVCAMTVPELAEAPVTLVWVTDQLKVVPATLLVRATVEVCNEQMLCEDGLAVADGIGFTVTVAVIGVPVQAPAEGVIV